MSKIKRIFLDLDDVLNRFTMPALHHVGCPVNKYTFQKFPVECGFDIIAAANSFSVKASGRFFCRDEFWSLFDENFWANLPTSSEMIQFIDWAQIAVGLKDVYILTAATGEEGCLEGKRKWIIKKMGSIWAKKMIICTDKFVCANEYSILIDDSQKNIDRFRQAGGYAIIVPRPWNKLHKENSLIHVKSELSKILKSAL